MGAFILGRVTGGVLKNAKTRKAGRLEEREIAGLG
jgi:hypothetical protein